LKHSIIGSSKKTRKVKELIKSFARNDASVLVTGESGCGKELYAREIHELSPRNSKPFVPINCGAIPAELLESQLFGHKRGSFTGAVSDFKGKFREAHTGTIFLDEIGDMPLDMQVKLLRVLQERQITPIGSNELIDIDVRVVSATHRDLEQEIRNNRFREDLYFRLNILPVHLPPLRDRPSEIAELAEHFLQTFAVSGAAPVVLSDQFTEALTSFKWPGNIRELSNTMQRLSVLYPGQTLNLRDVDPSMLPTGLREAVSASTRKSDDAQPNESELLASDDSGESVVDKETEDIILMAQGLKISDEDRPSLKASLSSLEKDLIQKALEESEGNVSRSAKLLKIQRTTLIERIKKYDLNMKNI